MQETDAALEGGNEVVAVRPLLRLIPTGSRVAGEDVVLSATLLLSPVPVEEGAATDRAMNLVNWPREAARVMEAGEEGALRHLVFSFAPTPMGDAFAAPAAARVETRTARTRTGLVALMTDDDRLATAWRRSIVNKAVVNRRAAWGNLCEALARLHGGKAVQAGRGFTQEGADPQPTFPILGTDGQIEPGQADPDAPQRCAAILGTGLPDANVLLQRLRAEECLNTLKDKGALTPRDVAGWDENAPGAGARETEPEVIELNKFWSVERAIAELGPSIPLRVVTEGDESTGRQNAFAVAARQFDRKVFEKIRAAGLTTLQEDLDLEAFRVEFAAPLTMARKARLERARKEAKIARFEWLSGKMQGDRTAGWKAFRDMSGEDPPVICAYEAVPADVEVGGPETDRKALQGPARQSEYGRWPSYATTDEEAPRDGLLLRTVEEDAEEAARTLATQAYFGIECNPGLARAFGLAFDIEITFRLVDLADHPYGLVAARLDNAPFDPAPCRQVHTRIKLRKATDPAREPDWGWPVTTGEVCQWASGAAASARKARVPDGLNPGEGFDASRMSQFDGVLVMSGVPVVKAQDGEDGARPATVPRFDVATLDVAAALEAERRWLDAVKAARERDVKAKEVGRAETVAADEMRDLLAVGPDYQSNGLTLLNRAAVQDAVRKLLAIHRKTGDGQVCSEVGDNHVIYDADDVTQGFRLLVGVPTAPDADDLFELPDTRFPTTWRSLMGRRIEYGTSGDHGDAVERCLGAALGAPGEPKRVALEGAMQSIPSRSLPTGDGKDVETIVTEDFGQWDGNPGGVTCARVKGNPPPVQDSNAFGRTLDLPRGSGAPRPPQLRFGWPYRFAVQAVYSGGHAVPVEDMPVEDRRATDVTARLYYPSRALTRDPNGEETRAVPYIRALRHARIGAPTVLLPSGHATRKLLPMGYDSTGKMIVRTLRGVDPAEEPRECTREQPRVAQRLVLVPPLPQAVAARHLGNDGAGGILDRTRTRGGPPAGALSDLVYDTVADAGFPVARTSTVRGINDRRYLRADGYLANRRGRRIVAGAGPDAMDADAEDANAVYQPRSGDAVPTTYYPDPAAERLVLRLRRSGGDLADRPILPGRPLCIDLTGSDYPEVRRILLSLRAAETGEGERDGEFDQGAVMKDRALKRIRASASDDIVSRNGRLAHEVAFLLKPGEHFVLEVWHAPSPLRLARDFAVVQTLAQKAAAGRTDMAEAVKAAFREEALDGPGWEAFRDRLDRIAAGEPEGPRYVGLAGGIVPGTAILHALGLAIHEAMLCHPVYEIAAVRRIELVHAVNRPAAPPAICTLPPERDPFPAVRTLVAAATRALGGAPEEAPPALVRAIRPATLETPFADPDEERAIGAGSKHLMLTGEVALDLEQVDTVEITARCVSPDRAVFEDAERGRSLAHRLAGTWPEGLPREGEDGAPTLRKAREIFGFELARDGRVSLPRGDVTLLRIEDIPPPGMGESRMRLDLAAHFADPPTDDEGETTSIAGRVGRVGARHLFPDGKARRLELRFNGLARTAAMMETAARELGTGDPWLGTSGIAHEKGDLLDAQPLPRRLLENLSPPAEVIMPATVRPAEPDAREASHAIERQRTIVAQGTGPTITRIDQRVRTRLRFGRGWFSSGVDERIGIVTWPPNQAAADAAKMADNTVHLRPAPETHDRTPTLLTGACPTPPLGDPQIPSGGRPVPLPMFQDEDLGPGGRFVTRRGMDPTRIPQGGVSDPVTQIFLSKEEFPDLWRHPADPALAEYVPHALLPLGDADGTAGEGAEEGAERAVDTVPPMACGLITYMPRFDPVAEEWYCDIHLEPGKRADQIVRFGLVRYQPHTRLDLRCSRPVQVFCQPLPDRRVDIHFKEGSQRIVVTMTGPISVGRLFEKVPGGTADDLPNAVKERMTNVMRVTAFADGKTPLGGDTREHVAFIDREFTYDDKQHFVETRRDQGVVEVKHDGSTARWRAEIPLGAIPRGRLAQLSLRIEEIDYRLPADFRDTLGEPVKFLERLQDDDRLTESFRERNAGLDVTEAIAEIVPPDILRAHDTPAPEPT